MEVSSTQMINFRGKNGSQSANSNIVLKIFNVVLYRINVYSIILDDIGMKKSFFSPILKYHFLFMNVNVLIPDLQFNARFATEVENICLKMCFRRYWLANIYDTIWDKTVYGGLLSEQRIFLFCPVLTFSQHNVRCQT